MLFRKKHIALFLMLLIVSTSALIGCSTSEEIEKEEPKVSEEPVETRTIAHEMGEVEIEGKPQNIVVLEFSFIDASVAAGVAPVGIADDGDSNRIIEPIKSQIGEYTSVGTRKQPSLEVISSLKPDLIIADLKRHKEIYDDLKEIAPTMVLNSLEANYEENIESFKVIAKALGEEDKAEERVAEHEEIMDNLRSQVKEGEDRKVMQAVVTNQLFNAHASNSYTGGVLSQLGFENSIQQEEAYAKLNLEQIVEINPDVLFVMAAGEDTLVHQWADNPLWKDVSAVKNGNVYMVDRNLWSRFRGIIASEMIAEDVIEFLYK